MRRQTKLRAFFWLSFLVGGALAAQSAAGCNDAPLIGVPVCRPGLCTCEEDPQQPTCKGFNDRPEGGKDPADATQVDTGLVDAPADAEVDAPDDAADAAD
jgi:hypothetical protein